MKETTERQSLLSSLLVMASTFGTRLLGFIRIALISALFGGGGMTDVLNWAFSIPNNFRKLLAEGALSAAFIPEISHQLIEDPTGIEARKLARSLLGLLLLIILPLCLLFVLFPQAVVHFLSDFQDPGESLLAASLMRYTINYLLLVAVSALFMGLLNSHNRFFIPAVTPLLFSVAVIFSLILFHKRLGIYSMALGVLTGGLLQILFQIPSAWRLGYRPWPSFSFQSEPFRRVMKRWLPIMVTSSIFAVNQQIAHYFASSLETGSITALSNALVFWQLPFGIFFNSIATVTYPKLSRQFHRKDWEGMGSTVLFGYSSLISLLIPSAVIFMLMGPEVIAVTLQRGAFQLQNSQMAGRALFAYSTGLLSVGLYNFTQRVFYSMGNMRTPFVSALAVLISDVALTLWFLLRLDLGVEGLAYANTLAFSLGFVIQLVILKSRLPLKSIRGMIKETLKVLASLVSVFLWVMLFRRIFGVTWWEEGSTMGNFGLLALEGLTSVALLVGSFFLFRLRILSILRKRGVANEN